MPRKDSSRLFPVKTVSLEDLSTLDVDQDIEDDTGAPPELQALSGETPSTTQTPLERRNTSNRSFASRHGQTAAFLNIVCSTLGASVLALPYAYARSGIVFGTLLLALCAQGTMFSISLLVQLADSTGAESYQEIAGGLFGSRTQRVVELVMITFCYGVAVGYVVAVRDTLEVFQDIPHWPLWLSGSQGLMLMTSTFWALFMFPLSCYRKIGSLSLASLGSVLSVGLTSILISAHYLGPMITSARPWWKDPSNPPFLGIRVDPQMLVAFPLMMFSFCCQPNAVEVYRGLKDGTPHKMDRLTTIGLWCCTALYVCTGVCGYLDFGNRVRGNVLAEQPPGSSFAANVAFLSILLAVTLAFPLCILPTRSSLELVFQPETIAKHHFTITLALTSSALVLGLYAPGLTKVFGFLGGIGGSLIGFVFPTAFALKANVFRNRSEEISTWALLFFGLAVGAIGSWTSLFS